MEKSMTADDKLASPRAEPNELQDVQEYGDRGDTDLQMLQKTDSNDREWACYCTSNFNDLFCLKYETIK